MALLRYGARAWIGAVAAVLLSSLSAQAQPLAEAAPLPLVDFRGEAASIEVRRIADLAVGGRDARGRPFAIVDKKAARLYVFEADGRLLGATSALLGLARGDASAPGVGMKVMSGIPRDERTTPAGRFESEPGRNLRGEAIVWFDYDAALAIHRLRPTAAGERRPERLASDTPADNRITLGCVVVSGAFYDQVVATSLGRRRGIVYVLPEAGEPEFAAAAADKRL